ncbi:hypothetical protein NDU88_006879 [Pleurodeles waltl]|uniref:Uncharacterized protein n=1 Tax=Pleurodeles waltl TaxID=8319 RepID=A0AAV7RT55_PLEWA|nr:hypothetical protein NDU88_006879 [Pleurodeles waltl]
MIINVYINPGMILDYDIQMGLLDEDLEAICVGEAEQLVLILGDFNHKLDPASSDKLYKELLTAAQIPQSIFLKTERTARNRALVRILGSLGLFCINGRKNTDHPTK